MGDRRRGLEVPFGLAGRSLSEGGRGRDEEDDTSGELLWDGTDARAESSGEGVVVLAGRAEGDRSVEGFLGNDRSLTRDSFEAGAPVAGSALSSVLRFFCRLAFSAASSSGSLSSRDGFFRFTLAEAGGVTFSSTFSLSLSVGVTFFDMRMVEVAVGFRSWVA